MPRKSPYKIELSAEEQAELEKLSRKRTAPYYLVVRAKAILMAAQGMGNQEIGERLGEPRQIVSQWRKRFFEERMEGLEDRPRPGRPPSFSP
jgi:transposase